MIDVLVTAGLTFFSGAVALLAFYRFGLGLR